MNNAFRLVATDRSPAIVQSEINQVREQLASIFPESLPRLRVEVMRLTTDAVIDPGKVGALTEARMKLQTAEGQHASKMALDARLMALHDELAEARRLENQAIRAEADRRYQQARAIHQQDCLNAMRSYRRLINEHRMAMRTDLLPAFHSGMLVPMGWQGHASDAMQQGPLPFEADEKEQQHGHAA